MTTKLPDYDMTHRNGGNGWAVVAKVDADFSRVTLLGRDGLGEFDHGVQFFLAADDRLERTVVAGEQKPFNEGQAKAVYAVREQLASGEYKVVNTRLVKA